VRVAIVYDCLYPHTVGGAERWYRMLAERLSHRHEVTYVTRRQWRRRSGPQTGFETVAVSPGGPLYKKGSGRRRILGPLLFGLGVFWHMLRRGRRYDVVHSASFPYFSLLGAGLALRLRGGGRIVVDWHEVWSRDYWIDYLGPVGGRIGHAVQRLCVRMPDHSFTFSRLHAERLRAEGHTAQITRHTGEYAREDSVPPEDAVAARPPLVVFAGRHIPEKRVALVPDAVALARAELPELRCTIFGDGPELSRVRERVEALGLSGAVELAGRVDGREVREALAGAACLLLPSAREGYGLVVVEAIAHATPAVVVSGSENAAVELVEPGVNGFVSTSPDPREIAARVVDAVRGGEALRRSTYDWYREHEHELSIESSLEAVERVYAELAP
jgi:glycosyltransferase involved in cell wall biosynthesis